MNKLTLLIALLITCAALADQQYPFWLEPRGYSDCDLEPHIDRETMKIHYEGHHAAYVNNLNEALASHKKFHNYSYKKLLEHLPQLPETIRAIVRNNAGGHANHTFFWKCMTPKAVKPSNRFKKILNKEFGSLQNFKDQFNEAAKKVFGSGWVWLCLDPKNSKLSIITTPNQDSPLMDSLTPLLGLDVWEHAYYLKHQNKRASYIEAWWSVINWPFVEENYNNAISQ